MARVFVAGIGGGCYEEDLRRFFRGFGRICDVSIKRYFAFVEFESDRDADDAIHEMSGRHLNGFRVSVERAHHPPKGRDLDQAMDRGYDKKYSPDRRRHSPDRRRYSPDRRRHSPDKRRYSDDRRDDPPQRTRHQILVKNLAPTTTWRDLRELMRKCGEVVYTDVDPKRNSEGLVCFSSRSEMDKAMKDLQGSELLGKRLKLIDEGRGSRGASRSRSRSRSRFRSRSRSSSRSYSTGSSRRSRSPKKNNAKNDKRKRSKSASPHSRRSANSKNSDDMKHSTSGESNSPANSRDSRSPKRSKKNDEDEY